MSELFCNQCHSTVVPGYRLGIILNIVGTVFAGFAFIFLFAPAFFLVIICGAIAALCFAGSYSSRTFFCGACGSPEVIPAESPKAREFQLRHQAFEHVQERMHSRPHPEIYRDPETYYAEKNITPQAEQPRTADRLSAFRDEILREEQNS